MGWKGAPVALGVRECLIVAIWLTMALSTTEANAQERRFEDRDREGWLVQVHRAWRPPQSPPTKFRSGNAQTTASDQIITHAFYVTDRVPSKGRGPASQRIVDKCGYSPNERNDRGPVHGVAEVFAPADSRNLSQISNFACRAANEVGQGVKIGGNLSRFAKSMTRVIFHLHGYATTFNGSIAAATYLNANLDEGPSSSVPVAYSWPAKVPGMFTYTAAEEQMLYSKHYIRDTLRVILAIPDIRVDLFSHSLGTRGLADSVSELLRDDSVTNKHPFPSLRSLTLMSADIPVDGFNISFLPHLGRLGKRVMLYSSAQDGVLSGLSHCAQNREPRVGTLHAPHTSWSQITFVHVKQKSLMASLDFCVFKVLNGYWYSGLHSYYENSQVVNHWSSHVQGKDPISDADVNEYGAPELDISR